MALYIILNCMLCALCPKYYLLEFFTFNLYYLSSILQDYIYNNPTCSLVKSNFTSNDLSIANIYIQSYWD